MKTAPTVPVLRCKVCFATFGTCNHTKPAVPMPPPPLPTIREEPPGNEHHRAKFWRTNVMKMAVEDLAKATGYTAPAVYLFEAGCSSQGKKISPWVWQRWKLICAGIHAEQFGWPAGNKFDWDILPRR